MTTGRHVVRDLYCVSCNTLLGWKYLKAFSEREKYKEGKYILERLQLVDLDSVGAAAVAATYNTHNGSSVLRGVIGAVRNPASFHASLGALPPPPIMTLPSDGRLLPPAALATSPTTTSTATATTTTTSTNTTNSSSRFLFPGMSTDPEVLHEVDALLAAITSVAEERGANDATVLSDMMDAVLRRRRSNIDTAPSGATQMHGE